MGPPATCVCVGLSALFLMVLLLCGVCVLWWSGPRHCGVAQRQDTRQPKNPELAQSLSPWYHVRSAQILRQQVPLYCLKREVLFLCSSFYCTPKHTTNKSNTIYSPHTACSSEEHEHFFGFHLAWISCTLRMS